MTIEEYTKYSNHAINIFNYMNGNINKLCSCILEIGSYDFITGNRAIITYPNRVTLYIGKIIDDWDDNWGNYTTITKEQYVLATISWALAHELHHADQLISMVIYNQNADYKNKKETDVEIAGYNWIWMHERELSAICNCNLHMAINCLYSKDIDPSTNIGNYVRATPKEFYLQTIANIILIDLDLFDALRVFTNDEMCDDMILVFNNIDSITIKSYGKYLEENINKFVELVYKHFTKYTRYNIHVEVTFTYTSTGRRLATVLFTTEDSLIDPVRFMNMY